MFRYSRQPLNAAYHERIHRDQSNLIPLDPEAFIQTALDLLASDRYLEKGMGLDGPDRAQARSSNDPEPNSGITAQWSDIAS